MRKQKGYEDHVKIESSISAINVKPVLDCYNEANGPLRGAEARGRDVGMQRERAPPTRRMSPFTSAKLLLFSIFYSSDSSTDLVRPRN